MSLQKSTECDLAILDRFLDEELSQLEVDQLTMHLETCQPCCDYLETSAADSRSWADASELLKTDSFDNEKFLTTTGHKSHDPSSAIEAIIAAFAPSDFPDRLGRIGIYEVTGVVGSGATGVVFKAIDPSLDRTVAIKVLLPTLTNSGTASKRFEREAKAAAAVLHPNVVPIHGVSNTNGLFYLVMAYVGGESLQKRLSSQGPLALAETLRVGAQIAAGLAAAHDQGLVHRDIKPANIILEDNVERVAITDFGLARAVDDASLTMEGIIAGTPRYMSPEQAQGKSVTQQTDLFSLGSVLYAISTGRPPFRAESSFGVMRKICEDQPLPIRDLNPEVPDWLAGTIEKLMSKTPEDRFQSAREVAGLLENGLAHVQHPTEVPLPDELKILTQRRQKSSPFSITAIAMITILVAAFGILLAQQGVILVPGFTPQDLIDRATFANSQNAIFENAIVSIENSERVLQIRHSGEWFNVESIAGTPIKSIFKHADEKLRSKDVNRRIIEDLPALMKTMGVRLGSKCDVELKNKNGTTKKFELAITAEKRRLLFQAKKNFKLTGEMFRAELDSFQKGLESQFAYYRTNNVDLDAEIKRLTNMHPDGLDAMEHGHVLQQLMAKFIDGHARVDFSSKRSEQALPFLIEPVNGRFVAFYEDRESLVDPQFPYITKIDGIAIEELLKKFNPTIAQGSPQFVLRQQLRASRDLGTARKLAGLPATDNVKLQLVSENGTPKQVELFVANNSSFYGTWPRRPMSGIVDDNLGYLRLNQMDSDAKADIKRWMPRFKDTDGLIVDVRDNGGGTREALIELATHLMTPETKPRVANVCKYRKFDGFRADHLRSRYAFTADQYGEREQQAISEFMATFKPEWEPKESEFSDWHFLVLSKASDDPTPVYKKRVVILMNEKCFSATDIFLAAFKGWPNVTLVGQPSGGGSAKSEDFKLPISQFEVRCASMASFQPNGKLYDTNGIEPDSLVIPSPEYFLRGGTDDFLKQAVKVLKSKQE